MNIIDKDQYTCTCAFMIIKAKDVLKVHGVNIRDVVKYNLVDM